MTLVLHSSHFDVSAGELFEFHRDARNLGLISPPVPRFELLSEPDLSEEGDEQLFRLSVGPFGTNWKARITRLAPGRLIEDTQESGPFLRWRHQHRVSGEGAGSRLTDVVAFRALPTPIGEFVESLLVRPGIKLMFLWRHRKTRAAFAATAKR